MYIIWINDVINYIIYETECRVIKYLEENKFNVAKIMMFCWMSRHTRQDKIMNERIQDKIEELCLKWFGHVRVTIRSHR
ncbi:hypothetical protein Lal_00020019 [Lupinus albus]|nr:hypothetical protein Lal_00020019 [Lupinus albus]